jgi:sugar O-acyltransferase (sialic acid O-acetyltransferase NeuD family)
VVAATPLDATGPSRRDARGQGKNDRMSHRPPLVLLGGGGHAAVVAEAALAGGWSVVGYLDDDPDGRARPAGLPRLGAINDLPAILAGQWGDRPDPVGHAAVGDPGLRRRWLDALAGAAAAVIVHPSAVVSPSADLADGTFIGPRAVVNARAQVGRGAIVNSGAIIEHDCVLGPFCHVAPGATLGGGATVGSDALVGINAAVRPAVRVGDRATLGAGAVATSDIPDAATATGIPARTGAQAASASQERG